ncbi:MAG: c-type cytochrome [Lentimicrobium sp.]|jgi:cytochrome c5|nr:c-type cytochrome [Lentimicrobium sp.]
MKKNLIALIGGLLFAGALISCGGGGGGADAKAEGMKADLANGEAVYNKACIACHMTGVAGAAALTDKVRWEEIAAKGMKTLTEDALHGYTGNYGVMPEKGTCMDCTEQDLFDAISFMLSKAGVTAAN